MSQCCSEIVFKCQCSWTYMGICRNSVLGHQQTIFIFIVKWIMVTDNFVCPQDEQNETWAWREGVNIVNSFDNSSVISLLQQLWAKPTWPELLALVIQFLVENQHGQNNCTLSFSTFMEPSHKKYSIYILVVCLEIFSIQQSLL